MSKASLIRAVVSSWPLIQAEAFEAGAWRAAKAQLPERVVLLSPPEGQTKLRKASKATGGRWLNYGLALSPWRESGVNLCRWEAGCGPSCLRSCGQYAMDPAKEARLWRTCLMLGSPEYFRGLLRLELEALQRKAERDGVFIGIRLNLLSDLVELADSMALWAKGAGLWRLAFYDYTKSLEAARASLWWDFTSSLRTPGGWVWRVLSYTSGPRGVSWRSCAAFLRCRGSVAVVFDGGLPTSWRGFETLDGDVHDLCHPGEGGKIRALRLKGGPRVRPSARRLVVIS